MPKQIHKITTFHGGINNNSDPRDILDEQFEKADNVSLNYLGKIVMGDALAAATNPTNQTVAMHHGAEIIAFNSSYSGMHDGGGTALSSASTDYVAIGDNTDAGIWIFEHGANDWSDDYTHIDLGSANDIAASFYYVDGVLRMSDSNLNSGNSTGWMGPVNRERFKITTSHSGSNSASYTLNEWVFQNSAGPTPPTNGTAQDVSRSVSQEAITAGDATDGDWSVNDSNNYPTAHEAVMIALRTTVSSGAGSGWADGTAPYKVAVAVSFVYDGNQESPLTPITDGLGNSFISPISGTGGNGTDAALRMRCFLLDDGSDSSVANRWDPRITAVNVYLKQENQDNDYFLAAEYDLTLGGRSTTKESTGATEGGGSVNTNTWWASRDANVTATDAEHWDKYSEVHLSIPPKFITHAENSGIVKNIERNVLFKTAVVANRRVYLGNVSYKNDQSEQVTKEDAIIYSNVNQFDTFSLSEDGGNFLETNINDGDSIVKLLEFNDRLVEFKQNKVTIINIANPLPFIEQSLKHNGITQKAAAFRTDFGVVWANEQACWLYDGEKVTNLLQRDGVTLISQSNWSSFIQNPAAFYVPKTKQIGILGNTTATNGNVYLNDPLTQSWTYHPDAFDESIVSSIIINKDNKPMWNDDTVSAGTFRVWNAGVPATLTGESGVNIKLHTKDFDFGQPSIRKKVYKVYVSYKGDAQAVSIRYGINGETDTSNDLLPFYRTTADGSSDGTNSDTTPLLNDASPEAGEHWINAELKPVASINNIYSIQLFFDGTAGTDFEINDISIVYRMKSIK